MPNLTPAARRIAIWCAAVLTIALSGAPAAQAAVTGSTPWVVLRCQFSDDTSSPGPEPILHDLFTTNGTSPDDMVSYWRDMSGGAVDLTGSTVAPGWFRMSLSLAGARAMQWPAARGTLIDACIAAADPSVDFSRFYGIIVATNQLIDSGSIGVQKRSLDGVTRRDFGLVNLDPGGWSGRFAAHEMGHGSASALVPQRSSAGGLWGWLGHHERDDVRRS